MLPRTPPPKGKEIPRTPPPGLPPPPPLLPVRGPRHINSPSVVHKPPGAVKPEPIYANLQADFEAAAAAAAAESSDDNDTEDLKLVDTPQYDNPANQGDNDEGDEDSDSVDPDDQGNNEGNGNNDNANGNDGDANGDDGDSDGDDGGNMAQNVAKPHQTLTLREYDGSEGLYVEDWARQVDRASTQYGWTPEATAAAAKQRLVGYAMVWLRSQEDRGNKFPTWKTPDQADGGPVPAQGLRPALIKRFYPRVSTLMASDAMSDLRQKENETGGQFQDRVVTAVQLMFHNFPDADKQEDLFKRVEEVVIFNLFSAGIKVETRRKIFQSANPPDVNDTLLAAVRNVEMENEKASQSLAAQLGPHKMKKKAVMTAAVTADEEKVKLEGSEQQEPLNMEQVVAAVTKRMNKVSKKKDMSNIRCYTCNQTGHFSRNCQMGQSGNNGNGYSNGYSRGNWNNGRSRGFSNRGRGMVRGRGGQQWRKPGFVNEVQQEQQQQSQQEEFYGDEGADDQSYNDWAQEAQGAASLN